MKPLHWSAADIGDTFDRTHIMCLGHENVSKAFVPTNYYKVDRTNWVPPTGSMKCVLCLKNKCMHADELWQEGCIRGVVHIAKCKQRSVSLWGFY